MVHPIVDRLVPLGTLTKATLSIIPRKGIAALSPGRLLDLWLGNYTPSRSAIARPRYASSRSMDGKLMVGLFVERAER